MGPRPRGRHGGDLVRGIRRLQERGRGAVAGDDAAARRGAGSDGVRDGDHVWGRRERARVGGKGLGGVRETDARGGGEGAGGRRARGSWIARTGDAFGERSWTSASMFYSSEARDGADASERAMLRERALRAALRRTETFGWTTAAIDAGLRDLNLSPAMRACVRADGRANGPANDLAGELVAYYEEALDAALHAKATSESERLRAMNSRERLEWLVRARLEMLAPKLDSWPGALAALATPEHATATLRRRAALADFLADAARLDDASDSLPEPVDALRRALERAAIGIIYSAVELRLITDTTERRRATWSLLGALIRDFSARRVDLLELRAFTDVALRDALARASASARLTSLLRFFTS